MAMASQQRGHEVIDGLPHHLRLRGDQVRLDSHRQGGGDRAHHRADVAAQREHVAAAAHGDAQPMAGTPLIAEHGLRRVGVAAPHGGNVAQTEDAPVDHEIDAAQVLGVAEAAGNLHQDALVRAPTTPAGVTAFCARRAAMRAARSSFSPASWREENSM